MLSGFATFLAICQVVPVNFLAICQAVSSLQPAVRHQAAVRALVLLQSDNVLFTTYGEWEQWNSFRAHLDSDYVKVSAHMDGQRPPCQGD